MRAAVGLSDRHQEVRTAARGWQRAGAIPETMLSAIDAAYPDDRARLGPVFRVLVFAFTFLIVNAVFGLVALVLSRAFNHGGGALVTIFGLLLLGATEFQMGALRRREGGTESATGVLALVYLAIGLVWIIGDAVHPSDAAGINLALMAVVLLFGLAGFWWGYELFVAVAATAAFVLLARGPFGRLWWMLLPLVLAPVLVRASGLVALAPAHRRSCQVVAAIALVCLYVAVHLISWDTGVVEMIRTGDRRYDGNASVRPFFVAATGLVPLAVIAWGLISRRRMLLNLGLVGLLVSLATIRHYVHVAPPWVVLLAGGGATIGIALALRRFLHGGTALERHGFTAEPLFSDPERRHALEVAAGLISLGPDARAEDKANFKGGGGRSGGAGASGTF